MPNHVTNRMTVTGPEEAVQELFDACFSKEKEKPDPYLMEQIAAARQAGDEQRAVNLARQIAEIEARPEFDVFDFNKIIPRPAFIYTSGNLRHGSREQTSGRNWYDWNIAHWGTKWGAYHAEINERDPGRLVVRFDTAWSPPEPVFQVLARWFPELGFNIEYIDEFSNFWGVFTAEADESGASGGDRLRDESYGGDRDDSRAQELRKRLCIELQGYDPDETDVKEPSGDGPVASGAGVVTAAVS